MSGMDYFTAVQQGKVRVKAALEHLQEAAGPSHPVLFLKMGNQTWTPVGDEELCAVVSGKGGTASVVICDADGNAKAMSSWVQAAEAERILRTMETKGLKGFTGEVKLPE